MRSNAHPLKPALRLLSPRTVTVAPTPDGQWQVTSGWWRAHGKFPSYRAAVVAARQLVRPH
ncbi:MAG: hypothetical protein EHM60_07870 [Lysobacterales bacterium]|nr:MAG: hypothetical protein EHM60_07870 [Xanthomonadales bacterium]